MRIEKGYHGWSADFGIEYTLFDAGLERFAVLDKGDFIGRGAVMEQRQRRADWVFAGFEVEGANADPLPGDPILTGGTLAGYVTSAGTGFRIGKRIAIGYLRREAAGAEDFVIEAFGHRCQARRVALPYYDPENAKLKG
jgi:dimethylglycine dehydrogenase